MIEPPRALLPGAQPCRGRTQTPGIDDQQSPPSRGSAQPTGEPPEQQAQHLTKGQRAQGMPRRPLCLGPPPGPASAQTCQSSTRSCEPRATPRGHMHSPASALAWFPMSPLVPAGLSSCLLWSLVDRAREPEFSTDLLYKHKILNTTTLNRLFMLMKENHVIH